MTEVGPNADQIVMEACAAVRGERPLSIGTLRRKIIAGSKSCKIGIDDFTGRIIAGINLHPKSLDHRTDLMDEVLGLHVWHRLHRGLMWIKFDGADRHAPVLNQFKKLEGTVIRSMRLTMVSQVAGSYMMGMIRSGLSDYEGAALHFRKGVYPDYLFMSRFFGGAATFRAPSETMAGVGEPGPELSDLLVVNWSLSTIRQTHGSAVMVFSCEEKYFNGFGQTLVESLIRSGSTLDVRIVVIADMKLVETCVRKVIAMFEEAGIAAEVVVVASDYETRTMSSVARYLWAENVMQTEKRDCFVFDLDVVFTVDSVQMMKRIMGGADLGLAYTAYGRSVAPWASYLAGGSFVADSAGGRFFLNRFRWYAGKFLVRGRRQWFIDQNAIFAADYITGRLYPSILRANTAVLLRSILVSIDSAASTEIKKTTVV